jgi:hypothetical protein
VEGIDIKEVSSGANVIVKEPYDEGVFYASEEIGGANVVSPVQLILDLTQGAGAGRSQEAAEFLLDRVLRREWQ